MTEESDPEEAPVVAEAEEEEEEAYIKKRAG